MSLTMTVKQSYKNIRFRVPIANENLEKCQFDNQSYYLYASLILNNGNKAIYTALCDNLTYNFPSFMIFISSVLRITVLRFTNLTFSHNSFFSEHMYVHSGMLVANTTHMT